MTINTVSVHIWETQEDVGHVSLSLPDGYLSLRPRYPLAVNPFTTFFCPVPATNFPSLEEDISFESRQPDRTIALSLSDKEVRDLTANCKKQIEGFSSGKIFYHLLPRWGFLPTVKALTTPKTLARFADCPFSGVAVNNPNLAGVCRVIQETTASHCALAVASALRSIGIQTTTSAMPWVVTPSEFGDSLAARNSSSV